ncbi:FAD-binding oxidoreductase [Brucella sp. NBRC 12950]|uniref:NAD(P)/FAD-dependent oxidoreductase n=1 Tax=Brucella sp. NBRC 12950 TaxID=2994518 RepID=UPI002553A676|nr:FAD-binding oxidoreductase [Brucella sp. NBRC 12950]
MADEKTLIIGAGILGLSVADALSRKGHKIQVLDKDGAQIAASNRSFSWLNSFGITTPSYRKLRLKSMALYRDRLPPIKRWFAFPGSINLIAEAARTQKLLSYHTEDDYAVERLGIDQVSALEPHLNRDIFRRYDIIGARNDGWVDLKPFLDLLRSQIIQRGGRIDTVEGGNLVFNGDSVSGYVTTAGKHFFADNVVVAAGADTPLVLQAVKYEIPARSNIGLIVKVRSETTIGLRHVLRTPELSLRPMEGGGLVLHSEASDGQIQSGDANGPVEPGIIESLISKASSLFVGSPRLVFESMGIGPRPIPGDGLSVFGAIPNIGGLYTAFSHSAATLGPVIGELLADEIADGHITSLSVDFRPDRFSNVLKTQAEIEEQA